MDPYCAEWSQIVVEVNVVGVGYRVKIRYARVAEVRRLADIVEGGPEKYMVLVTPNVGGAHTCRRVPAWSLSFSSAR